MPCLVIHEDADSVALFLAAGSLWRRASGIRGGPRGRNMVPSGWDGGHDEVEWLGQGVPRVRRFGEPWSVWRWLDADSRWSDDFSVNLEDPWRRTPIGSDSGDWILDIVARADGSWRFKDEDELAWASETGEADPAWVARTWRAAERAIGRITAHDWPFAADWNEWLPPHSDELPALPEDWSWVDVPGTGRW
jgi:hypothetical protein